jgi:hypothetical protein
MDMDGAIDLFNAYLDAEYAAVVATRTEPDDAVVNRARAAVEAFLNTGPDGRMASTIGRAPGMTAAAVEALAATVDQVVRRTLFQVVEYRHPALGRLFAGYAGGQSMLSKGAYGRLLYATELAGEPKIISEYVPDILEPAPPVAWSVLQGAQIAPPGRPGAVRQFTGPTYEPHRHDWIATREQPA